MTEYIARVSAKDGRPLHRTEPHATRDDAARAAFTARPKARSVSTARAHEGKETGSDIRWHQKADIMKESLAFLIEDALERSEVVIAAEGIVEKLQSIAEDLSTIEAKDIMPLLDSLTNAFGPGIAQKFNTVATEQIRQLVASVQGAKTALDGEIVRLKQGVEGGDMSDMALDPAAKPMMPSGVPPDGPPVEELPGGLPDAPPSPDELGAPAGAPELGAPELDSNFAGREKKESAKPKGKPIRSKVSEDVGMPHSHESMNLGPNLTNLTMFHGGAGKLAQSISNMIRTDELSLDQRQGLASVLSHLAAFAAEPAHWSGVDADAKIDMALKSANLWKIEPKSPAERIIQQLKRLAHLLSLHHDQMLESAISMLRKSTDPDALILKTFRIKLAEHRDSQMAAIRTARTFAIDIEDVVAVVREAAARRPFESVPDKHQKKIAISTLKMNDVGASVMGGMSKEQARKYLKSIGYSEDRIRKLEEDASPLGQDIPMFPLDQASPVTAAPPPSAPNGMPVQPTAMQPPVPPNQSLSTNKPLTPGDMRVRQQQQQSAQNQPSSQPPQQGQSPPGQPQANRQQPPMPGQGQPPKMAPAQQPVQPPLQMPGKVMNRNDPALKRASMQK